MENDRLGEGISVNCSRESWLVGGSTLDVDVGETVEIFG
jgi:hypothetical protein